MKKRKHTGWGLVVTCRACWLKFAPILVYSHLASCEEGRKLTDR